jgi:diguanylate cyclase (GGDEF)-like protein/PAS domain S-box-containing protein
MTQGEGDGDEGPSKEALAGRLREVELSLAETQRLAELGSWSWDVRTDTSFWSEEFYRLLGLSSEKSEATFDAFLAGVHPDDRETVARAIHAAVEGGPASSEMQFDYRVLRADGRVRWHRARGRRVHGQEGGVLRMFGTAQDITAARDAEQQLREQRDELAVLAGAIEATDEAVIVHSWDGTVLRWNGGAERLYGYTAEEAVGQHMSLVLSREQMARIPDMMVDLAAYGHVRTDSLDVRKDGTRVVTSVTVSEIKASDGSHRAMVSVARDVTEQKRSEERDREHARQLARLALHDPLTGLGNRTLLHDRLGHALARQDRPRTDVLLLDLDNFKTVNDVSGHAAGDQLLLEVARRLLTCVRPEDTVARLGGDEFAILLEDGYADAVAARVQEVLTLPVSIGGRLVVPRGSIGIGRNDDGTRDPDELLLRADVAMYAAKADGRDRTRTFTADMAEAIRARADLEAALRHAVRRGEIVVHYQPIVDVRTATASRVEALMRWRRPQGLLPPQHFLALAETSGLIREIGAEILRQALSDLHAWLEEDARRSVAVNVSAAQLTDARFADHVLDTLQATGARARQLVLEVTESMFLVPEPQLVDQLRTLQRQGVRVSIDDFGTGYSSPGRLQTLPVDSIKLDKSFVDDIETGHENLPILTSMIVMARHLDLDVTAEGVETQAQAERLAGLGCDHLQGYHFAQPIPAGQLEAAIETADETAGRMDLSRPAQ